MVYLRIVLLYMFGTLVMIFATICFTYYILLARYSAGRHD